MRGRLFSARPLCAKGTESDSERAENDRERVHRDRERAESDGERAESGLYAR